MDTVAAIATFLYGRRETERERVREREVFPKELHDR